MGERFEFFGEIYPLLLKSNTIIIINKINNIFILPPLYMKLYILTITYYYDKMMIK